MSQLHRRPAAPSDVDSLVALFAATEQARPVGLEVTPAAVHDRLAAPQLDLARDTVVAVDPDGRLVGYAETAAMGVGQGTLRIRLTGVVHPAADGELTEEVDGWLLRRAQELRRERHPELPAVLGTRCGSADRDRLDRLVAAGFVVTRRQQTLGRDLDPPVGAPTALPPGIRLAPFDHRYDEQTRVAHNEAYAQSPTALLPDAAGWPAHATGLPTFLPAASVLALTDDAPDGNPVAAFLFCLDRPGEPAALLHCLGTRPARRGQGLATAMIARALDALRDAGHRRVVLETGSDNPTANRLYARLGFTDTGRGHAVLMRPVPVA